MENNLTKEFIPHWGVLVSYTNGRSYGMFSVDYWGNTDKNLPLILTNENIKEIIKYGIKEFQENFFVIQNIIPIWMVN